MGGLIERLALDIPTGHEVALKLEHIKIDPSVLENEYQIYEELAGGSGIPRMYWYGQECEFRVMAFELLGPCGWLVVIHSISLVRDLWV